MRKAISFKPLHSGAFLLTSTSLSNTRTNHYVSNPFIAGHSFLRLEMLFNIL